MVVKTLTRPLKDANHFKTLKKNVCDVDFIVLSYVNIFNAQVLNEKYNMHIQNCLECHNSILIWTS